MKTIIILGLCCFICNWSCAQQAIGLTSITKSEFDKGDKETNLFIDKSVTKKNNLLKIGACQVFKDDMSDENYEQYNYIGDVDTALRYKVVRKILYNGEPCFIIDSKLCKTYSLLGTPHIFDSIIVNLNESETTDKREIVEVWKFEQWEICKAKIVFLDRILNFTKMKLDQDKYLLLEDSNGKYWRLLIK